MMVDRLHDPKYLLLGIMVCMCTRVMHGVSYQTGEFSKEFGDPGVRVPGLLKQSGSWAFFFG